MKQKHTKYTQIKINKSTHSEIGPVWQNAISKRTSIVYILMWVVGI